jgi:hypothetical protein
MLHKHESSYPRRRTTVLCNPIPALLQHLCLLALQHLARWLFNTLLAPKCEWNARLVTLFGYFKSSCHAWANRSAHPQKTKTHKTKKHTKQKQTNECKRIETNKTKTTSYLHVGRAWNSARTGGHWRTTRSTRKGTGFVFHSNLLISHRVLLGNTARSRYRPLGGPSLRYDMVPSEVGGVKLNEI